MKLPKIKNQKTLIITSSVLLAGILVFSRLNQAKAQTTNVLPMSVAPARQEIFVDPGESTAVTVKFFNYSDAPVSGPLKVADFIVEDKEGSPTFLEESASVTGLTKISPRFSAASWVSLPYNRITVASKNKVNIQAKINVPVSARPGGKYLAIYFEPGGEVSEATGGLKEATSPVTVRIAALIYLRVSGPIKEDAYVVKLSMPKFSEYGPVNVSSEILNRGDYHIRPVGNIRITNLFGNEVDKAVLKEQNIFPDTSRIFENRIGQKWMFGKYRAELTAAYGESGKALTAIAFFWVLPWRLTIVAILTILIVIILASTFFRRFKKHEEELEEKIEKLEEKLDEKK